MTDYVVDASVIVSLLIADIYTPHARRFFGGLAPSDRLIMPEFCLLECTNVLWKEIAFRSMQVLQANVLLRELNALPFRRAAMKRLLRPTLQIAHSHHLVAYDSAYIALARRYGCPLISGDQKQSRVAIAESVLVIPLSVF